MAKAADTITVEVHKFKEHKKVVRYKEADEEHGIIGSIYIDKEVVVKFGDPPTLNITIGA